MVPQLLKYRCKKRYGKAGGSTYASSSVTITAKAAATATISSLTESTQYDAYIVVEDNSSNIQSSATKVDIDTDKTAPTITTPTAAGITTTSFDFGLKINEAGTGYYVVVTKGVSLPTAENIKNLKDFSGNTDSVAVSGSVVLRSNVENTVSITSLSSETTYTVYYAAEDGNSNLSGEVPG
jgi:UDP-N-acetylmuramyl tripeptide synthase